MSEAELTLSLPGVAATRAFAGRIVPALRSGMRIGLTGELGAGKTEFVRQLVTELGGDSAVVCSPTYVLESVYEIEPSKAVNPEVLIVRHWDLYRLGTGAAPGELFDEPTNEPGSPSGITLVEWPERAAEWDGIEDVRIQFLSEAMETDVRQVRVLARSPELADRLRAIFGSK